MISQITLTVDGVELEFSVSINYTPAEPQTMTNPAVGADWEIEDIRMLEFPYYDCNWLYANSSQWRNHVNEQVWEVINA